MAELVARDEKVHVAVPDIPMGSTLRLEMEAVGLIVHEIPLKRVGMNPVSDLKFLAHLVVLMRRTKPKRVLCYTVKPVIYGLIAAVLARVPYRYALITGLGYAFQGGDSRTFVRSLVKSLYKIALKFSEKTFFQNPDDEALFRKLGLIADSAKTSLVNGSGVNLTEFAVSPLPNKLSFLFIGRLLGDKGVREYVESARIVCEKYPDIEFGLVGWIDDNPNSVGQDELRRWIADSVIKFYGKLEDVRPAIANCSVYVLPSYREGTPRTVLEAMSMGRPVITTDAPGCRETVINWENGFLTPVRSIDGLVAAMCEFINDPLLVARMGMRSRELAEDKYDVNKVNQLMLSEMGFKW
ncbi:glycosyltransferase family 4 protein [Sedimenticola selenatireducens]